MTQKPPTYETIIKQVVDELDGPVSRDLLAERVMAIRTPQAKDPHKAVLKHLRDQHGRCLIYLDPKTILPIRLAYEGIRFRIPVSRQMVSKGWCPLAPFADFYHLPVGRTDIDLTLLDQKGRRIRFSKHTIQKKREHFLLGEYVETEIFINLKDWLKKNKARRGDHLLVTIQDWNEKRFLVEVEPAKKRQAQLLEQRNQILADIFFDLLENAHDERIWLTRAVPSAYAHLPDKGGYPPDHWRTVIREDPRMEVFDFLIRYSDSAPTMFDKFLSSFAPETSPHPAREFPRELGKKVYRFKAALKYRKGIWRVIEILGEQTLADFNAALLSAFEYDWDHLGGFWKLVRRGGPKSKRFRAVDLGSVNPLGEGDGADIQIASIGLQVGDRLQYVYDFGDWIEHIITLEALEDPQPGVEYPVVAAQNKPRHFYCQHCKEEGKRTVAVYVCAKCSNKSGKTVRVCEDCADAYHEDHWIEKILY